MKYWLLGGALLASALASAGDAKDQWRKDNLYNAKLQEPVSTMVVSGVNIRLGTVLERLTLLSGEGHGGKKAAGAAMALGLTLLGVGGVDTASREPLAEQFLEDDARRIGNDLAAAA